MPAKGYPRLRRRVSRYHPFLKSAQTRSSHDGAAHASCADETARRSEGHGGQLDSESERTCRLPRRTTGQDVGSRPDINLAPSILGLAFARAGLIAACYGSYENTDEGLFTDGAMLVSLMILLIPFLMIVASKNPSAKRGRTVSRASASSPRWRPSAPSARRTLSRPSQRARSIRPQRGLHHVRVGPPSSTGFAACADPSPRFPRSSCSAPLIVSEIELFITAYLPGASTASSRRRSHAFNSPSSRGRAKAPVLKTPKRRRPRTASSGSSEGMLRSRAMLITLALAIGLFSVVTGFLRGYPAEAPSPSQTPTRIGYALLTIVASVGIIAFVFRSRTA